jgi:hypothetical protein
MTWTVYQVTFRLFSPVHIGWHKLGNLQRTRPYITGRSLWGALTARLTRELGSDAYETIGRQVDDQLVFTYFYPSIEKDAVDLWPWPDQWDSFAWTFLGSYASTALENGRGAEAGSLHETEFIAPKTRDGQPVYLVGYFFEKDTCQLGWKNTLGKLHLGGERGYGWGRVQLEQCEKIKAEEHRYIYIFDSPGVHRYIFDGSEEHPLLTTSNETQLLAHAYAEEAGEGRGTIEPLIGRETRDRAGFGKTISQAKICWTPGSKAKQDESLHILEKGVWKQVSRELKPQNVG